MVSPLRTTTPELSGGLLRMRALAAMNTMSSPLLRATIGSKIELPPISAGKADQLSNKTIAQTVSAAVSATVDVNDKNVEEIWDSIRAARHPILNVAAPVSPVQMEYAAHKKAPAMLQAISEQVKQCRYYCEDVAFTAADATRAEREFLYQAVAAAIGAGATSVTLCDTAGMLLPEEFGAFVSDVLANVAGMDGVELYAQASDAMAWPPPAPPPPSPPGLRASSAPPPPAASRRSIR